jgi:hypothetical protein
MVVAPERGQAVGVNRLQGRSMFQWADLGQWLALFYFLNVLGLKSESDPRKEC